jgi:hypothetical protein
MSMGERVRALVEKLERGEQKSRQALGQLSPEQWQVIVYAEPHAWTLRDLLAHFVSAEAELLALAQDVARGGTGAPEGFDFDAFNAEEKQRLAGRSNEALLAELAESRRATLAWLRELPEETLDRVGRHPALGDVTLETMILAIYGHQLLHMRDVQRIGASLPAEGDAPRGE